MAAAQVHLGAGAATMAACVAPRSVDMVYMDPPFFTQKDWIGKAGRFSDRWTWDAVAEQRIAAAPQIVRDVLPVLAAGRSALLAYLLAMHELIRAARQRLRVAGSLWLHCDDTASAYLRIVGDIVFRADRFLGAVVWRRKEATSVTRNFARCHDTLLVFVRSGAALERLTQPGVGPLFAQPRNRIVIDGVRGHRVQGNLDARLTSTAKERCDYPTQKPVALLQQLIEAGSRAGDTVLDPCCGSGTTLVAAVALGRNAIGIDQSADAVNLACQRLGLNHATRGAA